MVRYRHSIPAFREGEMTDSVVGNLQTARPVDRVEPVSVCRQVWRRSLVFWEQRTARHQDWCLPISLREFAGRASPDFATGSKTLIVPVLRSCTASCSPSAVPPIGSFATRMIS
jgi:hypothetical protein